MTRPRTLLDTGPDGEDHRFDVDPFQEPMLLTGQDEIALALGHEAAIAGFEARLAADMPWLAAGPAR